MSQGIRAACLLAVASLAAGASADSVNITFDGVSGNLGGTVSINLSGGLSFADGSHNKSVWAGQLSHTIDGEASKTYCTELTQWAHSGVYDIVDVANAPNSGPMGQDKAEAIYRLFNATNGGLDVNSDKKAKAFQAIIWEIVYDFSSGTNLNSGKVKISGISDYWFNTFASFANNLQGNAAPTVIAYTNQQYQDQLGMRMVPLPGAAAMAGLGLGGIAIRRRRQA
ncbi:MAG: PEP-CTERM sorting domain-containing protein [Phycisphaerales bacterium]|nr:PEP-CTERM sorting domain-containing protein [Phycisphaerales bacterium]